MFLVHFSLAEIFVESDDGGTMEDDIDLRCQDPGREIQLKGPCHEIFWPPFFSKPFDLGYGTQAIQETHLFF